MNAPSRDISTIIEDAGLGFGTFGTDLFVSRQPDEPATCISVYDTGGNDPQANYSYERPSVQIRMRSKSYDDAYTKLLAIRDILHGRNNLTVGGSRYIQILQQSDVIFVGYDDQDRAELTLNFAIHRTA